MTVLTFPADRVRRPHWQGVREVLRDQLVGIAREVELFGMSAALADEIFEITARARLHLPAIEAARLGEMARTISGLGRKAC